MQGKSDNAGIKLVIGLGNPGRAYQGTRHNVGFAVVDALVRRWGAGKGRKAFDGVAFDARVALGGRDRRVTLFQPQTYMNLSGSAVGQLAGFYKAELNDVLVVLDDMALPLGQLRFRAGGSSGGHRGLADVLGTVGSEELPRLRIGIGSPPPSCEASDFVLRRFDGGEQEIIDRAVELAGRAVEDWIVLGLTYLMGNYNKKTES